MTLRDDLRALRITPSDPLPFDPDAAPSDPLDLFRSWLAAAIDGGVSAPHAMVLATATSDGEPSARTLLLKDVTREGLWFASFSGGPKGREIEETGRCALVLYWREQARQVRVTGTVTKGARDVAEADFLARHPKARLTAIAGTQSEPIVDRAAAEERASEHGEHYVPDDWTAYVVAPDTVEFWQSGPDRGEVRLRYELDVDKWSSLLIWP